MPFNPRRIELTPEEDAALDEALEAAGDIGVDDEELPLNPFVGLNRPHGTQRAARPRTLPTGAAQSVERSDA